MEYYYRGFNRIACLKRFGEQQQRYFIAGKVKLKNGKITFLPDENNPKSITERVDYIELASYDSLIMQN